MTTTPATHGGAPAAASATARRVIAATARRVTAADGRRGSAGGCVIVRRGGYRTGAGAGGALAGAVAAGSIGGWHVRDRSRPGSLTRAGRRRRSPALRATLVSTFGAARTVALVGAATRSVPAGAVRDGGRPTVRGGVARLTFGAAGIGGLG
ncbi:hypothetical protein [Dactylosporangium sp. NPDC000521]|uniref:hypothetical protein n=1 Tax=Dactylosporangium sp. NPDC000521 TaxID=3363975 RepID=UPI00368B85AD